jgi:hypothetical protein
VSNLSPFGRRPLVAPSVPKGDVLGTFETYLEAQKIVDRLSKADFEVKRLSIVGHDLTTVERVTGKESYGRRAVRGAIMGAWLGLFFGVLFFLLTATPNFPYVAAAIFIGAGLGMLLGISGYALNRRGKDFTSTHQVLATSYQVVVDAEHAARANELLSQSETLS